MIATRCGERCDRCDDANTNSRLEAAATGGICFEPSVRCSTNNRFARGDELIEIKAAQPASLLNEAGMV
jgi:hypothetical protein